jgi:DNA-binding response OmpR family regulator
MRLLYIEDNEKLALNTSASLHEAGFVVDVVHTAEDALHSVQSFEYDAIILDLGLPDQDGLEILPRIKSRNSRSSSVRHAMRLMSGLKV